MTYQQPYANYQHASYMALPKTRQVIMLYEGAIRSVQQAKQAVEQRDIEGRYNAITKACEIINGLQLCLDFDQGGEVAQLLYDYYAGIDMRLMSVQFSEDISLLELCIKHLTMMKDAWEDVHLKETSGSGTAENTTESSDHKNPARSESSDNGSDVTARQQQALEALSTIGYSA